MKRYYILALCLLIVTSCRPSHEALATQTAATATAIAAAWTATPMPVPTATFTPTLTPTAANTPAPTNTATPTMTPTTTPTPVHPLGRLIFHEADETIDYDWFTYVPENLDREGLNYILITSLHGNIHSPNYEDVTEESRKLTEWRLSWARNEGLILLVPIIPKYYEYQPVDFDLTCFYDSTDPFYRRPDLRVNLMIDSLIDALRADAYNVSEKVLIEGFSSGGMFAQRYALLHPERVQAIAAGQCGGTFTLPESSYDGGEMNWPVGINDFYSLVGYEFNRDAYMQVHQFIFIGDQDTEATTLWLPGSQKLWRSQAQIDFLKSTFGDTDPVRLENQVNYLNNLRYDNITFKMYAGVGHTYTDGMIDDLLAFFRAHRERD